MNILIVDDSKTVLRINTRVVEELGHAAYCAENGQEALEKLKDIEVGLILLDVNMPVMDGYKFLELTKSYRKEKGIKVFMCTTEGVRNEVVRALQLGANNYIIKPIKRDVLVQKIREIEK